MSTKCPLILASSSPRRKILLKQIGLKFKVIPSHIAEVTAPTQTPSENAKRIALEKAIKIAEQIKEGIIIGADTIVVLDRKIMNKPKSKEDAKQMLKTLSGREHSVYTGVSLVNASNRKHIEFVEETKVRFRKLEEEEIKEYIESGSPMDKAGAYGIQDDFGAVFVEKINGCFYNVVGFPLARFYTTYKKFLEEIEKAVDNK